MNLKQFSKEALEASSLKLQKQIAKLNTSIAKHDEEYQEKVQKLNKLEEDLKNIEILKSQIKFINM